MNWAKGDTCKLWELRPAQRKGGDRVLTQDNKYGKLLFLLCHYSLLGLLAMTRDANLLLLLCLHSLDAVAVPFD